MKQFFDKFEALKGASFIGIDNYENKNGEIANLSVLTGISVLNAKEKDLEKFEDTPFLDKVRMQKKKI